MKKNSLTMTLIFCFFITAHSVYAQKVSYEKGIKIVENGKEGLWGNNPKIKLEYEGKFGNNDDKDLSAYFGAATDIAFDQHGNIYVLDAGQCKILKYDKNKKLISSFGRKGRGPGEMIYPTGISLSTSGNIYTYDLMQKRINVYSRDGKSIGTLNTTGYSLAFSMLGDDKIVKRNPLIGYAGADKPLFIITDLKGKKIKEFGEGPFPKGKATDTQGKGGGFNRLSFTTDKNMNIYAAFKFSDRIEKYDKEGKLNFRIKTSPLRSNLKNWGMAVDSKERIWLLTQQKPDKPEEAIQKTMMVDQNNGVSWNIKGNRSVVKTDIFALELYDKDGTLLYKFPLTHFIGENDVVRINNNKLYILENFREGTFHVYKISDL